MSNKFKDFIKNALDYYDNQKMNDIIISHTRFKLDKDTIYFYDKIDKLLYYGNYEILGYLDLKIKIWHWAWLIPSISIEYTKIAKELLNYGLKIDNTDTADHFFIRLLLLNSQINIKNNIEQEINIAICSYLIKEKIKFILPDYISNKNKITYYLVK